MSVDADIPASEDLFGLHVDDLQTNVAVSGNRFTGTLKYVTGYTGFSSNPAEQEGNYLAIHAADPTADSVTVEVVGGTAGERQLDSDGLIVLLIRNKTTQSVRVKSYKDGVVKDVKNLSLTGLTLEAAPQG